MSNHIYGTPCKKCGETKRYASSLGCVNCDAVRHKNISAEKKIAKKLYNDNYKSVNGHAYTKAKMKEYNKAYNAKKKGISADVYKTRNEISIEDRFLGKCIPEPNSGCWLWLSYVDKDGYGKFTVDGKSYGAHRISFNIFKSSIADDDVIRHTCDNPFCVNPDHLLQGTEWDNIQDRNTRGRTATRRLTDAEVVEVRKRHSRGEWCSALSAKFGVSFNNVLCIVEGRIRGHVG